MFHTIDIKLLILAEVFKFRYKLANSLFHLICNNEFQEAYFLSLYRVSAKNVRVFKILTRAYHQINSQDGLALCSSSPCLQLLPPAGQAS